MSSILFCFFPLIFLPERARSQESGDYLSSLVREARNQKLWEDRNWHLLLHYRKTWRGGLQSEAAGKDFFLAENGDRSPQSELEAGLAAFFDPPSPAPEFRHPQCRFPARYSWLKEKLKFDSARLPEQSCPGLETWRQGLDAESAALVYASSYLNNAASMYGHTFLRLNKKGHGEGERLLDHAVNYGAVSDTGNSLLFAIRGLTGGFPGRFNATPFYIMVQMYNNLESRDLWEYRLNLSPEEIGRLVLHSWELKSTHFPYYFLNKNCSYQLLPLLEAAAPRISLTPRRPLWVIPADTVRMLLGQKDMVASVRHRPSHRTVMLQRRELLTAAEAKTAGRLVRGSMERGLQELESLPPSRQALVLDAAEDYLLYKAGYSAVAADSIRERERRLLVKRAGLDAPSAVLDRPASALPPEKGHRTARIGLGFGMSEKSSFEELSLRGALHDLLDTPEAYAQGNHLEMGHLRLRYDHEARRPYLQEITLLKMASISPWDPWIRKPSWKLQTGLNVAEELGGAPRNSLYYGLSLAGGIAAQTSLWKQEIYYALAEADGGAGGVFRDGYRLGAGGTAGLLFSLTAFWRGQLEGSYLGYGFGDSRRNTRVTLSQNIAVTRDFSLRLKLERHGLRREAFLAAFKYF